MEIDEFGGVLRGRRVAAGRTIASVAADAGLSVPYIANLENGRGNPTLAAIAALAAALGARLTVTLDDGPAVVDALPDSLIQFARSPRFAAETRSMATADRERLLHAMAAMGAVAGRPLTDLDWHRVLDTAVLLRR
ncbi:MAG: helix-turn-helix transcriptional regulator [Hamadaea sp.]|nr:helix-turn-helix transcriptional regulator [Hamadaea sp.]